MGTCFTQKINTITSSTTSDSGPKKTPKKPGLSKHVHKLQEVKTIMSDSLTHPATMQWKKNIINRIRVPQLFAPLLKFETAKLKLTIPLLLKTNKVIFLLSAAIV